MTRSSLDFSGFITSRTKDFTGREWIFLAINRWLADEGGKRIFLLTGEPGCGKSALASCLVQLSQGALSAPANCPALKPNFLSAFHFCSASKQTWINPHPFTTSLALQLADHYPVYAQALAELNKDERIHIEVRQTAQQIRDQGKQIGVYIENLDVSRISAEDAFVRTVCEPLTVLATEQPNQQIVILVDALDEALVYTGQRTIVDLLARTEELPSNVRFLLTSRQEPQVENKFLDAAGLFVSADKNRDQNNRDIHQYITAQFREVPNLQTLQTQLQPDELRKAINTIVDKADGNFRYITFLLAEMANGQRQLTDLQELPTGLDGLYYQSLDRLVQQSKRNWSDDYAPICGILSVAQDALTLSQLVMLTKQPEDALWSHLTDLQQFVEDVTPAGRTDTEVVYRLYHQSVADFLHRRYIRREGGQSKNTYYLTADDWHRQIADYYWNTYHDDWMGCDTYGLNSLAVHLDQSSKDKRKDERLPALITKTWMDARYIGSGYTYNGFLADVDLTWQAVGSQGENKDTLPILVRLQTVRQIVGEEVSTYTDEDLRILVLLGREREALSNAQLRSNPKERFAGLLAAYSAQKNTTVEPSSTWLSKASEAASLIQDADSQARALRALAVALIQAGDNRANAVFDEAHRVASSIQDADSQARALRALAVALTQAGDNRVNAVFDEAHRVASSIQAPYLQAPALRELAVAQAQALRALAVALIQAGDNRANAVFDEAHKVASSIQNAGFQARALGELAEALIQAGDDRANAVFDEAHKVASSIQVPYLQAQALGELAVAQAQALGALAVALIQAGDNRANAVFDEAHRVASSIQVPYLQARALGALAVVLIQAGDNRANAVFDEAHRVASSIQDADSQAQVLRELAVAQARALRALAVALIQAGDNRANAVFDEAHKVASSIQVPYLQAQALGALAVALIQAGDNRANAVFDEAHRVASSIQNADSQAQALGALAVALIQVGDDRANAVFDEALRTAFLIQIQSVQTRFLSDLAIGLGRVGQFDLAHKTAWSLSYAYDRARVLGQFAVALAHLGDSRSVDIFEEAKKEACSIQDEAVKAEALGNLAVALAQSGRFIDAQGLVSKIQDPPAKRRAQHAIVECSAQTSHSAEEVSPSMPLEHNMASKTAELATALLPAKHFKEDLIELGASKLNEFLRTLAEWAPAFEQIAPGLAVIILREAIGIASWVDPFWRKIHALIAGPVTEIR